MRSTLRSTTGTAEAEVEAASGRGPTRPLAPARAPWGYAQGVQDFALRGSGHLDLAARAGSGGGTDGDDAPGGVGIYVTSFSENQKWVSCSCRRSQRGLCCVPWSGGDGDAARFRKPGRAPVICCFRGNTKWKKMQAFHLI